MARNRDAEHPQRSCLGCRTGRDKRLLLRFVRTPENEILPDLDNRLPGRGAYTCTSRKCLIAAVEQRQFKRSFKSDVTVLPADQLAEHVRQLLQGRIIGLLGLANKAGLVTGGGSMVSEALKGARKPGLVIVAADVSEGIGARIIHDATVREVPCRICLAKDDYGAILGKAPRSAVAIAPGGFVAQLVKAIDRYRNFLGEV